MIRLSRTFALLPALMLIVLLGPGSIMAISGPAPSRRQQDVLAQSLPAFPGAEGFGSTTVGGRGGRVIKVTNLNDGGPGSLRAALEAQGPRIVVFEVGGVIDLQKDIRVRDPYLTVAGQTAPGDGIMLRNAGITIRSHDVIIRGLTIRPGDNPEGQRPGVRRAITIWGSTEAPSYNIIVDHNSLSWSTDEVIGVGYVHDVTFSYNFITEPLHNSIHQEGAHGYAFALYGNKDPMDRITVHHNLIAHGYNRNPQFANGVNGEAINNIIYDWGNRGLSIRADARINVVGNHFIAGPDTPASARGVDFNCPGGDCGTTRIYVADNLGPFRPTNSGDEWLVVDGDQHYRSDTPAIPPSGVNVDPVEKIYGLLTAQNGAGNAVSGRPRDAVDLRILHEIETRSGHVRDCVDPDPIYYPQGTVQGAGNNTVTVEHHPGDTEGGSNPQNPHTYDGNSIEITSGAAAGQVRDVARFNPLTNVVTVDRPWDVIPEVGAHYRFIVHCDNNAGGWPEYAPVVSAAADSDGDGMPDDWESAHGLDPAAYDANDKDLSPEGYDNIEVYINGLIPMPGREPPTPTPTPSRTPRPSPVPSHTPSATPTIDSCAHPSCRRYLPLMLASL